MEFDIDNIHREKINISNSYNYIETSLSKPMTVNNIYNVTPIISNISNFEKSSRTQSLNTLSSITSLNYSHCSRHSINVCNISSDNNFTNDIYLFLKEVVENSYNNAITAQPQVLFNAPKRYKKLRRKQLPLTLAKRNFKKCTRLVRLRTVRFKYKPEKNIKRKLETYYDKTKRNFSNPTRIHQDLRSDSVLKAVSRSTVLKKVVATANLLEEADKTFLKDDLDQKLGIETSEATLTRINSESSQNDSITTKTVPSVVEVTSKISTIDPTSTHTLIQIHSDSSYLSQVSTKNKCINESESEIFPTNNNPELKNEPIFNTEIINVAVAQIDNASILKYKKEISSEQSREEILYKENLTSAESFMLTNTTDIQSSFETVGKDEHDNNQYMTKVDGKNCIVLTDMVNSFENNSSSDTFVVAKTSSYFKENSDSLDISSEQTLTPSSDLTNQTEPYNFNYCKINRTGDEIKTTLLDTIINVGIFQMPVTSSENEYSTGQSNDVIVTDELGKIQFQNKVQPTDKYTKNVIQKSFSVDNEGDRTKNIHLPNEDTIRSIITESEKTDKKSCSEEFRNYVPPLEMWDKIVIYFDMSLKRLEDSLVKKISNEIKESLCKFEKLFPFPLEEHEFLGTDTRLYKANESDVSRMESGRLNYMDEGMQCGLVQNEVIDELKAKMRIEGDMVIVEDLPLKSIKSRVHIRKGNDSFEVLKSPVRTSISVDIGKGDSLLTSSSEGVKTKTEINIRSTNRLVTCVAAPARFFRANMLVLTSVPAFFVSIYLVYSFFIVLT